jgi:hypothetical protein
MKGCLAGSKRRQNVERVRSFEGNEKERMRTWIRE